MAQVMIHVTITSQYSFSDIKVFQILKEIDNVWVDFLRVWVTNPRARVRVRGDHSIKEKGSLNQEDRESILP